MRAEALEKERSGASERERIPQATPIPIRTAAPNIYRRLQVCAVWVKQWLRREHSAQNYTLRASANRFFVVPTPVCFECARAAPKIGEISAFCALASRESSYDFDPPFVMPLLWSG